MGAVVFFACVLFVMGGVTAYVGDRLGSYIGKKRHSTFGLRPRHTAMLWTIVSGGVIAVGTLLLFLALNRSFQTALVRGPQLLASNRQLASQNKILTRRNAAAEQQALLDGALSKEAQSNANAALKTLASVSRDLGQARQALTKSQVLLGQRQAALASAQTQLADARHGLGTTRTELHLAQSRVRQARIGVAQAQRQYEVASREVVQANKSVLALVIKQDVLHTENTRLVTQNAAQKNLLLASQGGSLIFRREEELGRTVVAANQDSDALRRELAAFLDRVELTARQHGAGGLDDAPAIIIPAFGDATDNGPAAREAALDALSQNIAAQGGFMPSIVVIAEARYNTFKGEAVKLDLRPYANIMVFPKGSVIAHETVDGSQSEDAVFAQLQSFLTDQVRTAALQRGIIPLHDSLVGDPLVGRPIDSSDWRDLVKQIQKAGPGTQITAVAADDTYSADLLHLDLKVASSSDKTP